LLASSMSPQCHESMDSSFLPVPYHTMDSMEPNYSDRPNHNRTQTATMARSWLLFVVLVLLLQHVECFFYSKTHHASMLRTFRLHSIEDIASDAAFTTATASSSTICVVDFQKSKCKPCIKVAPLFSSLSEKYSSNVRFYKVDADSSSEALGILKANGIRSVPTFQIWNKGALVDTVQGAHIDEVEEILLGLLGKQ